MTFEEFAKTKVDQHYAEKLEEIVEQVDTDFPYFDMDRVWMLSDIRKVFILGVTCGYLTDQVLIDV